MPNGLTRILVINPRLEQAVSVKKVLESQIIYDVRSFTALDNALAFSAVEAAPDLVVMDVDLRGYKVGEVIAMLRRRRPTLPIILTGITDVEAQLMGAQAGIEVLRGRDLLPIIERLIAPPEHESKPDPKPDSDSSRATQPDRTQLKTLPTPPELFPKLAAEEPPTPNVVEGGTVRDLMPSGAHEVVVEIQQVSLPDTPTIVLPEADAEIAVPSVPQQILEGAQSDQTPDALVEQFAPRAAFDENDADLDSQPEESLRHNAPEPSYTAKTATHPIHPSEEPPSEPDVEPSHTAKTAQHSIQTQTNSSPTPARQLGRRKPPKSPHEPPVPAVLTSTNTLAMVNPDETAARKALQLTQAATESTAAACILTLGADLIAHAGELPDEEVEELRGLLKDDWQPTGKGSRIRFVTLPSTGQDYMLIARRTEENYTLTLAFAGDVPLSDIRKQSDALVRALAQVPEPESNFAPSVPSLPMTAIWTLSTPEHPLTAEAAQAIVMALDINLGDGWRIHNLNVHAEYIYVYCDTPADSLPGEVVYQLRNLTEQAVFERMPERVGTPLWSESYLALVPGREMGADEVRRFLRFSRLSPHRQPEAS
jgi:CheY-like chemotaxis protein